MELYQEILAKVLESEEVRISFPNLNWNPKQIVEGKCYQTLQKIKGIIEDDSLNDQECFQKIEEIICLFEELGGCGGIRHDFG